MKWLTRPVAADGVVVAGPLDPARLTAADLPLLWLRMRAVMDAAECGGRGPAPAALFAAVESLARPRPPADWAAVVRAFGAYFELTASGPIVVDAVLWQSLVRRVATANAAARDPASTPPPHRPSPFQTPPPPWPPSGPRRPSR